MRAFARRAGLKLSDMTAQEFARLLGAFLLPILDDLRHMEKTKGS